MALSSELKAFAMISFLFPLRTLHYIKPGHIICFAGSGKYTYHSVSTQNVIRTEGTYAHTFCDLCSREGCEPEMTVL
jgi:hypothetical protein